jgi:RND family efflux transporter MFP subunit
VEIARQDVATAEQGVRAAEEQVNAARANRQQVALRERDMQAAAAAIGQAASAENLASIQINKSSVYAPVAGTIAARHVDPGEGASPGMPVLTIVNNDLLYLEVSVSEEDLEKIEVGRSAEVTVDAVPDRTFSGHVYALNPAVHPASRTGSARISIGNPTGELRAGMFARASIVVEERSDVLVVPREAILPQDGKDFVYVAKGGVANRREVEVGMQRETQCEVVSGIEEGEQVIVAGQTLLKPGQRVKAQAVRRGDAQ